MEIFNQIGSFIIKKSFKLSVWVIRQFYDMEPYDKKLEDLKKLPDGTLGKEIANCLVENKLRIVPNFESHDLKHVLLDFKMTPADEIRMQAFMLGNGNYTLPCFAILAFGAILLPSLWATLYKDYKRGRIIQPVAAYTIEEYAEMQHLELQRIIFENHYTRQSILTMKTVIKFGSFAFIATGVFGMLFCLPFLFSSSLADIEGAGFPFIGGAILAIGGLLALSNLSARSVKTTFAS